MPESPMPTETNTAFAELNVTIPYLPTDVPEYFARQVVDEMTLEMLYEYVKQQCNGLPN